MTNPAQAMRMLITYAICIPLAIFVGYLAQDIGNRPDMSNVGILMLVLAIIISPIFIKWHYPILVFGLACPAICFFLPGKPPMWQIVVILSLGIAVLERILSSERRFISAPVMVWPLLFIAAMTYMTAKLTGGINLHATGGDVGGGRKYLNVFIGVAAFFALTSRVIPANRRNLYLVLFFLPSMLGLISDMFTFLPSPLNKINLLFPPTMALNQEVEIGTTRLVSFSFAIGTIMVFMLVKFGLRGIFSPQHPWRALFFVASFVLTLFGGFRSALASSIMTLSMLFFLERMHRTRLLLVVILGGVLGLTVVATFSDSLPYTFQRSMSFLPFKWRTDVLVDAQGSSEWRFKIWRATWPKVPEYLLLGKGFGLSKEDYDMIGGGTFAQFQQSRIDASDDPLAISSDFHSGPLTTLIPFGIWGAIGITWLMGAATFVMYRNYKYGDPALQTFNTYMFVLCVTSVISFLFIFGGFTDDVTNFAKFAGFSIAMNGGIARRPVQPVLNPRIKPLPVPSPLTASV
jgi:hypothetical protein